MFEGFSLSDFEAYLPEKWSSNMFTLPRRKVKDKLALLGKHVDVVLQDSEIPLVMHLSDDYPSLWNKKKVETQWLFFSRDEAAQVKLSEIIDTERTLAATLADPTPLYRHIFAGVAINQNGFELGIRLHYDAWVDRKNLLSLLNSTDGKNQFEKLRSELSSDWEIGLVDSEMTSLADLNSDRLSSLLTDFENSKGWIFIGLRLPKDKISDLGTDTLPMIMDSFKKLAPIYRFIAWCPENDAVSIDSLVANRQQELRASQAEHDKERSERNTRRLEEEKERSLFKEETEDRIRKEQEWRGRERAFRRSIAQRKSEEERATVATGSTQKTALPNAQPAAAPAQKKPEKPAKPNNQAVSMRSTNTGQEKKPTPRPQKQDLRNERPKPKNSESKPKGPKRSEPITSTVSNERKADIHVGDGVIVQKGFLKGKFGIVHSIEEGDLKVAFGALTSRVPKADVEGRGPAPVEDRQTRGKTSSRK